MSTIANTVASAGNTAPSSPSAPVTTDAAPTNFLQLLAQIVGDPAQQAITPLVPAGDLAQTDEPLEEGEAGLELLGMLPLSLPTSVLEQKQISSAAISSLFGTANNVGSAGAVSALTGDAQVLSEMIEAELAMSREGANASDGFQLAATQLDQPSSKLALSMEALSRPVQAPVGSSQWADEIGTRLTMMTEQGKQAASLRLSPEHLGPLEIRIAIRDDQASVWFGAAHADTRAAIEHALPRLRELFEAQGMTLADAGVYQEAPREQGNAERNFTNSEFASQSMEESVASVRVNLGLVDAYA